MKKKILGLLLSALMVFQFAAVTSAATTEEIILKAGDIYEFIEDDGTAVTTIAQLSGSTLYAGADVRVHETSYDRDGVILKDRILTTMSSINVYSEGRTYVVNEGPEDYRLRFSADRVKYQQINRMVDIPVEQTGKLTVSPSETGRLTYISSAQEESIDVVVSSTSNVDYTVKDATGATINSGTNTGIFKVAVPFNGYVDLANSGIYDFEVQYYTDWVKASKFTPPTQLPSPEWTGSVHLGLAPGKTMKVTSTYKYTYNIDVLPQNGVYDVSVYNADGTLISETKDMSSDWFVTTSLQGVGTYAIITNHSDSTDNIMININKKYMTYERQ